MSEIALVVAASRNGVIGDAGGLPWRLPSDLKRFKTITIGKPVIMGRKTWESLPRKPLPDRLNIVITRSREFQAKGACVVHSRDEALAVAETSGAGEICVIGGAEVYQLFLPVATRLYLTQVELEVAGDTRLPEINFTQWSRVSSEHVRKTVEDTADFTVNVYERVFGLGGQ